MKEKLVTLDIYKALGAFLVIFIHITANPAVTLKSGVSLLALIGINRFSLPAVPAFIFASGMALVYSYQEKEFYYGSFLKRRFTKILIPYLIWCLIYFLYNVKVGALPLSAEAYLSGAVTGRLLYHLYFVVIILQFYLLFGLFLKFVQRVPGQAALPLILLVNLAAVKLVPLIFPGNADRIFLTYLMYFILGCYFGKNVTRAAELTKRWALPILAGFLVFGGLYCRRFYLEQALGDYSGSSWDSIIYLLFCSFGVLGYYLAALGLERLSAGGAALPEHVQPIHMRDTAGRFVRTAILLFAAGSYYIYLAHPLAIIFADKLADRLMMAGTLDRMFLEFVAIYLSVVPVSILYSKVKSLWKRRKTAGLQQEKKEGK